LERRVANDSRETDTKGQKTAQLTELRMSPTDPGVEVSRGVDTGATSGQMPAPIRKPQWQMPGPIQAP
jgi:hypothetical protein